MEQFIDLHTHSAFSDGTLTPEEIINLAVEKKLKAVALTDHDTVGGIDRFLEEGKKENIEAIGGIELAAFYANLGKQVEIHVVGLFMDHTNAELLKRTQEIIADRVERNKVMLKKLEGLGFPMTYEELKAVSGSGNCTRAHYARLMVEKGYIKTKKEAFEKYISPGMPGFVPRKLISPKEAIYLIHQSGGVAVLAHPTLYGMNFYEKLTLAKDMKLLGMDGIEVKYSTYDNKQEKEICLIADKAQLLYSGGSDFHGINKADIDLGTGRGNLKIPYEFLEKLKEKRGK